MVAAAAAAAATERRLRGAGRGSLSAPPALRNPALHPPPMQPQGEAGAGGPEESQVPPARGGCWRGGGRGARLPACIACSACTFRRSLRAGLPRCGTFAGGLASVCLATRPALPPWRCRRCRDVHPARRRALLLPVTPQGDHLTLLAVYDGWKNSKFSNPWCYENFVQVGCRHMWPAALCWRLGASLWCCNRPGDDGGSGSSAGAAPLLRALPARPPGSTPGPCVRASAFFRRRHAACGARRTCASSWWPSWTATSWTWCLVRARLECHC